MERINEFRCLSLESTKIVEKVLLSEINRLEKKLKKISRVSPESDLGAHKEILEEYQRAYREVEQTLMNHRGALFVLDLLEISPRDYNY